MKEVAIIGAVGLPPMYGGFETLAEYLTKYLSSEYQMSMYCSAKSYEKKLATYNGASLKYIDLKANGIESIPYDIVSMVKACKHADTLLILGVSGCIALPFVKLFSSRKFIVNIDGLEWKRRKWNRYAKWFLKFSEKQAVKYADITVTDNQVIQDYVFEKYGKESVLIAYGGDHVKRIPLSREISERYVFVNDKYAFTVCRIEPENKIHTVIEAMSMQNELPLVIVGNWDSSEYGMELRKKYAGVEHIHLLDPIYDQNILDQIRSNCYVYLHGHSAGGTNPSLVEAMYLALPVFAYGASYNIETSEHQASYFHSVEDLLKLVNEIDEEALKENANRMYAIASRRYVWEDIAREYAKLF